MGSKKTMRVALDVAMTIMIVLEMFIQFTGEFLHEVIGFAFFATIIAHIALSSTWVKNTARSARSGRLGARRAALALIGSLLAITTIVLGMSSMAISGILASVGFVWPFGTYAFWATVHTLSAYALCALTVVHLAMHWAFLASVFKVPYDPTRRRAIGAGVNVVAGLGVVGLGIAATKETFLQVANAAERSSARAELDKEPFAQEITDVPAKATAPSATDTSSSSSTSKDKKAKRDSKNGNESSSKSGQQSQDTTSNTESTQEASSDVTVNGSDDGVETTLEQDPYTSSEYTSNEYDEWNAENESENYLEDSTDSTASGICTLCRKQCSLSAPGCDRPYEAGLI